MVQTIYNTTPSRGGAMIGKSAFVGSAAPWSLSLSLPRKACIGSCRTQTIEGNTDPCEEVDTLCAVSFCTVLCLRLEGRVQCGGTDTVLQLGSRSVCDPCVHLLKVHIKVRLKRWGILRKAYNFLRSLPPRHLPHPLHLSIPRMHHRSNSPPLLHLPRLRPLPSLSLYLCCQSPPQSTQLCSNSFPFLRCRCTLLKRRVFRRQ